MPITKTSGSSKGKAGEANSAQFPEVKDNENSAGTSGEAGENGAAAGENGGAAAGDTPPTNGDGQAEAFPGAVQPQTIAIEGVSQPVVDYVRGQIEAGEKDTKKVFAHAQTLDRNMSDWKVENFNARVWRKIKAALEKGGVIVAAPNAGGSSSPRKRAFGGSSGDSTGAFKDMLTSVARSRMAGEEVNVLDLYRQVDNRAGKFCDMIEQFNNEVTEATKSGDPLAVFDVLTTIENRADSVAKLFA